MLLSNSCSKSKDYELTLFSPCNNKNNPHQTKIYKKERSLRSYPLPSLVNPSGLNMTRIFFYQKFFWPKNFFGTIDFLDSNICFDKKKFDLKIRFDKKICLPQFFLPNIFFDKFYSIKKILIPQFFLALKFFVPQIFFYKKISISELLCPRKYFDL